jgi:hypothetical protein
VDRALARRSLSAADREDLAALLPLLSPEDRETFERQITSAASSGALRIEEARR